VCAATSEAAGPSNAGSGCRAEKGRLATSTEQRGARFFDEHRRDRGWAHVVVRRKTTLGRLIALDVTTTEAALEGFLRSLDKAPLQVRETGEGGVTYRFVWASGYANGTIVRVQGVLQDD
jgi:hypothetical protein